MPAKWVDELMIYDKTDGSCTDEAKAFLENNKDDNKAAIEGISSYTDINLALMRSTNLVQVSFCTHGFDGGVYFPRGSLTVDTLKNIEVPSRLFKGMGRLLFMGCDTAKSSYGTNFLKAAGKRFFAGRGGIVGACTTAVIGNDSGSQLPLLDFQVSFWPPSISMPTVGYLKLFQLDAAGKVIAEKSVRAW